MEKKCYTKRYIPKEEDKDRLERVHKVIHSLHETIELGEIDSMTREIIGEHFFESMQVMFEEYFQRGINLEEVAKKPYISLFESAMLIGSIANPDNPECLLVDSDKLFSDAFLKCEISPRDPDSMLMYKNFHRVPRVGIVSTIMRPSKEEADLREPGETGMSPSKEEADLSELGKTVISGVPDLFWVLNKKEVAEFAILKGYPCEHFNHLLRPMGDGIDNKLLERSELDLEGLVAWHEFKKKAEEAIIKFPDLKITTNKVVKCGNLPEWLKSLGCNTREAELIKCFLTEKFKF